MSPSPVGSFTTYTNYDLPPTVKSMQAGWLATFQSSAVASVLFAGIESQLLSFIKSEIINMEKSKGQALLALTYVTLFLSVSATMTSLILTDEFGELHLRASRQKFDLERAEVFDEPSETLLSRFNGNSSWRWVMWHWLFTLITGYICFVIQIVLYVWLAEETAIKVPVLLIAIITTIPILDLFRSRQAPQQARQSGREGDLSRFGNPGSPGHGRAFSSPQGSENGTLLSPSSYTPSSKARTIMNGARPIIQITTAAV